MKTNTFYKVEHRNILEISLTIDIPLNIIHITKQRNPYLIIDRGEYNCFKPSEILFIKREDAESFIKESDIASLERSIQSKKRRIISNGIDNVKNNNLIKLNIKKLKNKLRKLKKWKKNQSLKLVIKL